MTADKELAFRIYCALLARDPLAQQRFQELGNRFAQLATLSCEAAIQFEAMHVAFDSTRNRLLAGQVWDTLVTKPTPKDARIEAFVSSLKKAQLEIVDQLAGVK